MIIEDDSHSYGGMQGYKKVQGAKPQSNKLRIVVLVALNIIAGVGYYLAAFKFARFSQPILLSSAIGGTTLTLTISLIVNHYLTKKNTRSPPPNNFKYKDKLDEETLNAIKTMDFLAEEEQANQLNDDELDEETLNAINAMEQEQYQQKQVPKQKPIGRSNEILENRLNTFAGHNCDEGEEIQCYKSAKDTAIMAAVGIAYLAAQDENELLNNITDYNQKLVTYKKNIFEKGQQISQSKEAPKYAINVDNIGDYHQGFKKLEILSCSSSPQEYAKEVIFNAKSPKNCHFITLDHEKTLAIYSLPGNRNYAIAFDPMVSGFTILNLATFGEWIRKKTEGVKYVSIHNGVVNKNTFAGLANVQTVQPKRTQQTTNNPQQTNFPRAAQNPNRAGQAPVIGKELLNAVKPIKYEFEGNARQYNYPVVRQDGSDCTVIAANAVLYIKKNYKTFVEAITSNNANARFKEFHLAMLKEGYDLTHEAQDGQSKLERSAYMRQGQLRIEANEIQATGDFPTLDVLNIPNKCEDLIIGLGAKPNATFISLFDKNASNDQLRYALVTITGETFVFVGINGTDCAFLFDSHCAHFQIVNRAGGEDKMIDRGRAGDMYYNAISW